MTTKKPKDDATAERIHILRNEASSDHRDAAIRELQRVVASHLGLATEEVINGETVVTEPAK